MTAEDQEPTGQVCADCGKTADVLAAFWGPQAGPFDGPSGYACIDCRPSIFEPWMHDLVSTDSAMQS